MNPEIRKRLDGYLFKTDLNEQDLQQVVDIFQASGTIQAAKAAVDQSMDQARTALQVFPESASRQVLVELINLVAERQA